MSSSKESSSQEGQVEKVEARKKATDLLAQGKRNMVCGEIPKAVTFFEEAVKLLVENCGELSYDCAEAYFSCGSALLELGRLENSVLGVALEGVDVEEEKEEPMSEQFENPPAEDGKEREKLRKDVWEAMSEGERAGKEKSEAGDGTEKSDKDTMKCEKDLTSPKSELSKEKNEVAVENDNNDNTQAMETNEGETDLEKEKSKIAETSDCGQTQTKKSFDDLADQNKDEEVTEVKDESKKAEMENIENKETKKESTESAGEYLKDIVNTVTEVIKEAGEIENGDGDKVKTSPKMTESKENYTEINSKAEVVESKESSLLEKEDRKDEEITKSTLKENATSDKEDKADIKEKGHDATEEMETDANGDEANEEDPAEVAETAEDEEDADTAEGVTAEEGDTAEGGDTDEEGDEAEGEAAEGDAGVESQEGEGTDKGGDDVGNFQLAWEHLDLAKVIYLKSESSEDQLKAAECHLKLGEVSMEAENHEQASEDLSAALKIQQKCLPADDRLIAETHYTLGLAYGMGKDFENSITHYQSAISVIEAKIASLSKLVEEKEVDAENKENQKDDPLKKVKDEIKDLKELIPEMQNKIEDTQIEKKDLAKMMEMAKAALGLSKVSTGFSTTISTKTDPGISSSSSSVDENGVKKASDIAHLVRKKRKPEEEDAPSEVDTKKLCKEATDEAIIGNEKKEEINGQCKKIEEEVQEPEAMTS